MASEQPYDPYIPAGGQGATATAGASQNGNQRTAALQAVSLPPLHDPFDNLLFPWTTTPECKPAVYRIEVKCD